MIHAIGDSIIHDSAKKYHMQEIALPCVVFLRAVHNHKKYYVQEKWPTDPELHLWATKYQKCYV